MISRRDMLTGGVFGAAVGPGGGAVAQSDAQTLAELQRITTEVRSVAAELRQANDGCSTGRCESMGKVREAMSLFLRGNQKFPDELEVAGDVFIELYDWHVRNRQPLTIARLPDGRYTMLFMFTTIVLRPDTTQGFVGVPYDVR
jgi:hypothetical protein